VITDKEFDLVAQNAHVLAGALAVLGSIALWGPSSKLPATVMMIAFAAIKEFWYDQQYESPEVRGSNLRDFTFYCVGIAFGWILFAVCA